MPLEPVYPLVFFDALRIKIRDEGMVRNKAVYVALGVRAGLIWIKLNRPANPRRQTSLANREPMKQNRESVCRNRE